MQNLYQEKVSPFNLVWLPIFMLTSGFVTCFLCIVLFISKGKFNPKELPTISETARGYPMSKIIAVGLSLVGVCFYFFAQIFIDQAQYYGYNRITFLKFISIIGAIFFIGTGCLNLSDNANIHGIFSIIAFFSLYLFLMIIHYIQNYANILRFKTLKTILLILDGISTLIISILAPTQLSNNVEAITEYILLICLFCYIGLLIPDVQSMNFSIITHQLSLNDIDILSTTEEMNLEDFNNQNSI